MITTARIDALRALGGVGWLTALRAPQIAALAADDGPLQLSLFDEVNLAEFAHPDYPGERLVAARNPALAAERARKRRELLALTEASLAPVLASVASGRLAGAGQQLLVGTRKCVLNLPTFRRPVWLGRKRVENDGEARTRAPTFGRDHVTRVAEERQDERQFERSSD